MKHHVHHHHHHVHGLARAGRRRPSRWRRFDGDVDQLVAYLEERQRDFEQAAADLADKIRWLKERSSERGAASATGEPTGATEAAPAEAPADGEPAS